VLGERARDAAPEQAGKERGQFVGGFAGDGLAVVTELGPGRAGREEGERPPALLEVREGQLVLGRVEVGVEVVNPELVEVAEDDVARASTGNAGPVAEGLPEVLLEVGAALLHFDQHHGFPDEVSEGCAAAVLGGFAQAEFDLAADIGHARLAESLKEPVEEDLGLSFFVAGDVVLDPGGELSKQFLARHGGFVHESAGLCQQTSGVWPGLGFGLGKDE
jgi:hypothetical protein